MAATAVYAKITPISRADGKQTLPAPVTYDNISATTAAFTLSAGKYMVELIGATFGTVILQVLGEDGSTYLTATTAFSANGVSTVDLGAGQYRLVLA